VHHHIKTKPLEIFHFFSIFPTCGGRKSAKSPPATVLEPNLRLLEKFQMINKLDMLNKSESAKIEKWYSQKIRICLQNKFMFSPSPSAQKLKIDALNKSI